MRSEANPARRLNAQQWVVLSCSYCACAWTMVALVWSGAALPFPGDKLENKILEKDLNEARPEVTPYGSALIEHHSNIFALSGRDEALARLGEETLDDTLQRNIAGVEISVPLSNQRLHAILEGRRFTYDHFSRLDHDEYLANLGLDLHLGSNLDGMLEYQQERRMAHFGDRDTIELTLETERTGTGSLSISLSPEWHLETGLRYRELDSPLPTFPEFSLIENTFNAELLHLIGETLATGLYVEYLTGQFKGTPNSDKFYQDTVALTMHYSSSELSSTDARVGYSVREDGTGAINAVSELVGEIAYSRELTGKTTLDLQAFRRVQSYVRDASSQLETGVGMELGWKPSSKIMVAFAYQLAMGRSEGSGREDDTQAASLKMSYQALPWLSVRPYLGVESRDSNIDLDSFSSKFMGLELQVRF